MKCQICRETTEKTITLPSSTAYDVCYECFMWYISDFPMKKMFKKMQEDWGLQKFYK